MQNIISDLIAIKSLAKEVHWNASGAGFLAIHPFLDEVYETCDKYIDEVAEHMVASGLYGGTPQWASSARESFPSYRPDVQFGLEYVASALEESVRNVKRAINNTNADEDPAGEDILIRILQDLTKHWWFADAELGDA